jgi:hypothetical protein
MTKGERFFRQTRQIFAGIIDLWQENLTKHGGKIAGFGRVDDFRTHPNAHPYSISLKNLGFSSIT